MSATFSPDGRYVAADDHDGLLSIWDARTGHLVAKSIGGDKVGLNAVTFTPHGNGLASRNISTDTLHSWDVSTLKDGLGRHTMKGNCTFKTRTHPILEFKGDKALTPVSLSSDNRWVLSNSWDDNLCILDARSGDRVCTLKGHQRRVWTAGFGPAGQYLASGDLDGLLRLWRYEML